MSSTEDQSSETGAESGKSAEETPLSEGSPEAGAEEEPAQEGTEELSFSPKDFVHLHVHTQYSLLDSLVRLRDLVNQAKELGHSAVAITDHGNMHGAVEFYSIAKDAGIKPIIGCDLYFTPGSRLDRTPKSSGGEGTYHLPVLASNETGYKNLCRILTKAYKEGFYYKPRADKELLEEYREGLIVLSGSSAGELFTLAESGQKQRLEERLDWYQSTFGESFYLEVFPHQLDQYRRVNDTFLAYSQSRNIPLVAGNDCHYLTPDEHYAQEVLMCISAGKRITDPDRFRHEGVKLHLKSVEEMKAEFGNFPALNEALTNTARIASQCNYDFDFSTYYMPPYITEREDTLEVLMEEQAREGLEQRFAEYETRSDFKIENKQEYFDRLEEEIVLINQMGFAGYFLVVADFIIWAK